MIAFRAGVASCVGSSHVSNVSGNVGDRSSAALAGVCLLVLLLGAMSLPARAQAPNWIPDSPGTVPPARELQGMAYDAAHQQVVMFGGTADNSALLADTWTWNGIDWVQQNPTAVPPARYGPSMDYDATHSQVVMFGGLGDSGALADTWTWNGTNWLLHNVAAPAPRFSHAMAYDANHQQMVLFGGVAANSAALGDTWTWDGTVWTQRSPVHFPSARDQQGMSYDSARQRVVMFGGFDGSHALAETWTWDGTDWTQQNPTTVPPARYGFAMAYDAAQGRVVLFGGFDGTNKLDDTWVWSGTNWTRQSTTASPLARYGSAMAYDADLGQVILFGGVDNTFQFDDDTWIYGVPTTITATSAADDGSPETLRSRLAEAVPGDTINFDPGLSGNTITVNCATGPIVLSQDVSISGPGPAKLAISGNHACQVIVVNTGVTAAISGVTIENGASVKGSGISNAGTLTLSDSIVSGNSATDGAGIFNYTELKVTNSTLSGNTASGNGGGIYNAGTGSGALTVINSTLSGNSATIGGGIYDAALTDRSILTVSNSTLSGNSATIGGGIYGSEDLATLKGTLLAGQLAGGNCLVDPGGTFSSDGYNLSDDNSCTFLHSTGDQNNVTTAATFLGPLQNNGGPTPTMALLTGSTAIDKIPLNPLNLCSDVSGRLVTSDQRGITRPQGATGNCDIGAYEVAQMPQANVCPGGIVTPSCSYTITLQYNLLPSQVALCCTAAPLTQGAPNLDFGHYTLTVNTSATPWATVAVTFGPLAPGLRLGEIQAFSGGGLLDSNLVYGTGIGPALAFTPGIISTVAGNGLGGYDQDGIAATAAELHSPAGVTVDSAGNLYIADFTNNRIRKVGNGGQISTVAGEGDCCFSADNIPATTARIGGPVGVAVDGGGNLYIAEYTGSRVRKVAVNGIITTFAGNGNQGQSGDNGPATSAELSQPWGLALDGLGNLYIADSGNCEIRKVDSAGTITTVAGNGSCGNSGDNGPATSAKLSNAMGIAVDAIGELYIADSFNLAIRKVGLNGVISTIAYSGDGGLGLSATFGVALDAAGNLYAADFGHNRIRKISPLGVISTLAGTGSSGFSGDSGPATGAMLVGPTGLALDGAGNLYVADRNGNRVRKVDVSTSALSFPNTNVAQSSATQNVVVADVGNAGFTMSSFGISSNFQLPAPIPGDCLVNTPLPAGAVCNLEAYFAPVGSGPITGTISVTDTAPNSPQLVNLSGTGISNDFSISASPNTVSIQQGASSSTSISTALTSGSSQTVAFSISGVPVGASASFIPSSVTAGQGATLNLGAGTAAPNTYSLTVTGTAASGSHSTSVSLTVTPLTVGVAVGTSPPGLAFTVDDGSGPVNYSTTQNFTWTIGSHHTVATTSPQGTDTRYTFTGWSDSGAISHPVTAAAATTTYVASFSTSYQLTTAANPTAGGMVTPASGNYYAPATPVSLTASPNLGYLFSGWTGLVGNAANASTSVTMSAPQTVTANFTPIVSIVPGSIPFGTIVQYKGVTQLLLVTNNGKTDVKFTKISLGSLQNITSQYLLYDGGCMTTLSPGKYCRINISIAPNVTGNVSAVLTLQSNAPGSPQTVPITATVIGPKASLSPSSLSFGNQTLNTPSGAKTVTLSNPGVGPLTISGIAVTGSNVPDFGITTNGCGGTLGQGLSCTVNITFTPKSKGSRSATLTFTDNSTVSSTQTVSLTGTGK